MVRKAPTPPHFCPTGRLVRLTAHCADWCDGARHYRERPKQADRWAFLSFPCDCKVSDAVPARAG